jgi:hypothetical protein
MTYAYRCEWNQHHEVTSTHDLVGNVLHEPQCPVYVHGTRCTGRLRRIGVGSRKAARQMSTAR